MKVQLLHIVDCPGTPVAELRVREALDALGLTNVPIELVMISTEDVAASMAFAGSPTILVDGVDLFPAQRISSLACRIYATEGGIVGSPTRAQIQAALTERVRAR